MLPSYACFGKHLYLFPEKTTYIPRFWEVLGKRLWLAGYGRVEISRSGSLLSRTIIDLSVGSPDRLDFVAGAVCKDGLEQRLPEPEYKPGALLDIQALQDLTEEEETQYQRLVEQVKEKAGSAQETVRTEYVDQEAGKLVKASDGKLNIGKARQGWNIETVRTHDTSQSSKVHRVARYILGVRGRKS